MSYLDVVPLDRVKTYLRIDDSQNETDSEITSMIKSACRYIERSTNILIYKREKTYDVVGGCVNVYDFPINSVVSTYAITSEKKRLYTLFSMDTTQTDLVLDVGYELPADVPDDIIELILVVVKAMFYAEETNQNFKDKLPDWANLLLNQNRRFIL